jgi:hypothetical protein
MAGWTQEQLQEMSRKGYRYHCTPLSGDFEALCTKTMAGIAELMRTQYPNERFKVCHISHDGSLYDGPILPLKDKEN